MLRTITIQTWNKQFTVLLCKCIIPVQTLVRIKSEYECVYANTLFLSVISLAQVVENQYHFAT